MISNQSWPSSSQTHFHQCSTLFPEIGCEMFTNIMAHRATTISLSILVTVEMFNAMNSLSENASLFVLPVWRNPFLVAAIALSMALHVMILYVPFFTVSCCIWLMHQNVIWRLFKTLFQITPLNWAEWQAVLYLSAPVLVIDEVLKFLSVSSYTITYLAFVLTRAFKFQATFVDPPSKMKVE